MGSLRDADELSKDGVRGGTARRVIRRTWRGCGSADQATAGGYHRGVPPALWAIRLQSREFIRAVSLRACLSFVASVALALAISREDACAEGVSLVPRPVKLELVSGVFELNGQTTLAASSDAEAEARKLAARLRITTGLALPVTGSQHRSNAIVLELDRSLEPRLGAEGYRLSVKPGRVIIRAGSEAGLFYGGVTFRQLLPAAPERPAPNSVPRPPPRAVRWMARGVEIEDYPRFPWRGLLIDPARHFLPPEFIEKLVEVMALHKLNTLQLHLTDDQGWRIEIKKYPRLTQIGSVRRESPRPHDRGHGDGKPYGPFFYTQEEIRHLVAYAQARHVTLVPEFEIPGHIGAAMAAYPEFTCRGRLGERHTPWGIEPEILCPGNDAAVAFVLDILGEICEQFPSRFIHIGGDEVPRDRWKTCPKCQSRLKAEGLKDEAQLQTWLNHRLEECLIARGRRLIGWDEILDGGLTPGATVMSWRGTAGGIAAATAGHDVVMSPTSHCYFDYAQAQGPGEPECIGGFIPLSTVYEFEPTPPTLPESGASTSSGRRATCGASSSGILGTSSISPSRGRSRWPKSSGLQPRTGTTTSSSTA